MSAQTRLNDNTNEKSNHLDRTEKWIGPLAVRDDVQNGIPFEKLYRREFINPAKILNLPKTSSYELRLSSRISSEIRFTRKHLPETSVPESYPYGRKNMITNMKWIAKFKKLGLDSPFLFYKPLSMDLTYRPYTHMTYRECLEMAASLARGIEVLNLAPMKDYPDAGYRKARNLRMFGTAFVCDHRTFILEIVTHMTNLCMVPLYSDYPPKLIEDGIRLTEIETLFIDYRTLQIWGSYAFKSGTLPKTIVLVGDPSAFYAYNASFYIKAICKRQNTRIITIADLLKYGQLPEEDWVTPDDDDVWTISFTSGTCTEPKACILKWGNIRTVSWAMAEFHMRDEGFIEWYNKNEEDQYQNTYFSFIPTAHIYERTMVQTYLLLGYCVAYATGEESTLLDEAKEAQTTEMAVVPVILEAIHKAVWMEISSMGRSTFLLFKKGIQSKIDHFRETGSITHFMWDNLIFNTVRKNVLGPHMRCMISGGTPVNEVIKLRCQAFLSCRILQGYGLTESTAAILVQHTSQRDNSMGFPFKSCLFRLVDYEAGGYYCKNRTGQLVIHGASVIPGYFRNSTQKSLNFDKKGWFYTGDIVRINRSCGVEFVDRIQDVFRLRKGQVIAPGLIETQTLALVFGLGQAFITHDADFSRLICFLEMDEGQLSVLFGGKLGRDLQTDASAQKYLIDGIRKCCHKAGLRDHEIPRKFAFMDRKLGPTDKILTPSSKVRRTKVQSVLATTINYMTYTNDNLCISMDHAVANKPIQDCVIQHAEMW